MLDFKNFHDILTESNLRDFGFEADFIRFLQNDIAVCMNFAQRYVEQSDNLLLIENYQGNISQQSAVAALGTAATLYRRAGASSLLIWDSSREARRYTNLFLFSARCYYRLRSAYDDLLKSLMDFKDSNNIVTSVSVTFDGRDLRQPIRFFDDNNPIQQVFQEIYSVGVEGYDMDNDLLVKLRTTLRGINVGVLDIPITRYLDLIEAFNKKRDLVEVYQFFILSYDEAFRIAMRNAHLWNLLAHPFHPAEPDILTLLTMNKEAGLQALEKVQNSMLEATVEILKRILDIVE